MAWTGSRNASAAPAWDAQTFTADANASQAFTSAFEEYSMIGDVGPSAGSDFYDVGSSAAGVGNASEGGVGASRDEALVVWEIITLVLIFTLTVFGNVVVLFMLLVRRKKLTRMCYFILSLCMSDLITAFLNVLPQLIWEVTYRFHGGGFLCKAVKFGQLLGPYLNSYLLVMTALDRYQVICYPLSNCSWTPRSSKNMIFVAWVLALGSCTPQVFIFSYQEVAAGTWDCWASFIPPWGTKAYVTWYALSVFIVPLFILIFVYSCICRTLWVNSKLKQMDDHTRRRRNTRRPRLLVHLRPQKYRSDGEVSTCLHEPSLQREELSAPGSASAHASPGGGHKATPSLANGAGGSVTAQNIRLHPWNPRSHSVKSISRAKIKTVKLTVTVILCYVSCSAPFISVQLWHVWDPNAPSSPFYNGAAFTILTLLASLNSVVNPWIFLGFNENLTQLLRSLCACRLPSRWGRWRSPTFRSSDSTKNFRLTVFTTTEGDNLTLRRPSFSNRLTTTSN
ncbi:annetocin receptor [Penaeus vannamei]|uniref:annetocin receptor n=1 Tax=Penaeus vannamei TaxID=6689 RepID=UPI00387F84CA